MANLPSELHRFMSSARGYETLSTGELRLSQNCFNDPFELLPASTYLSQSEGIYRKLKALVKTEEDKTLLEKIKGQGFLSGTIAVGATLLNPVAAIGLAGLFALDKLLENKNEPKTEMEKTIFYLEEYKSYIQRFQICCFSTSFDDILMWSHYAKQLTIEKQENTKENKIKCVEHGGMAITFSTDKQYWKEGGFRKINYDNRRMPLPDANTNMVDYLFDLITHKAECWKYEQEWRLLTYDLKSKKLPFNPKAVTAIRLGLNFPNDMVPWVQRLRDKTYKDVPVLKARLSNYEYKLEFNEI